MVPAGTVTQPLLIPISIAGQVAGQQGLAVWTIPAATVAALPGLTAASPTGGIFKPPVANLQGNPRVSAPQPPRFVLPPLCAQDVGFVKRRFLLEAFVGKVAAAWGTRGRMGGEVQLRFGVLGVTPPSQRLRFRQGADPGGLREGVGAPSTGLVPFPVRGNCLLWKEPVRGGFRQGEMVGPPRCPPPWGPFRCDTNHPVIRFPRGRRVGRWGGHGAEGLPRPCLPLLTLSPSLCSAAAAVLNATIAAPVQPVQPRAPLQPPILPQPPAAPAAKPLETQITVQPAGFAFNPGVVRSPAARGVERGHPVPTWPRRAARSRVAPGTKRFGSTAKKSRKSREKEEK